MNVIFLDFDGVIDTFHYSSHEDVEKKIKILGEICRELDCKVVIEAAAKDAIDEKTNEIHGKRVKFIFDLFNKYGIDCIGRTPNVVIKLSDTSTISMWKEHEIRKYLFRHPEIDHYCVIDDDDLEALYHDSDLNKVRDHLVTTLYYSDNPEEEGLLPKHKEEVREVLKKDNDMKKLALKRKQKHIKE